MYIYIYMYIGGSGAGLGCSIEGLDPGLRKEGLESRDWGLP